MRTGLKLIITIAALLIAGATAKAQNTTDKNYDVFVPIAKYLSQGNTEALSAWFADNLEINVLSKGGDCSRSQAKQILKSFFDTYSPHKFEISHTAGRAKMKYALGSLSAGGENFLVTIFVSCKKDTYRIQQLEIERM